MAAAVIRWASIGALYDPNFDRHRARAREYEHAVEEAKARTIEEGLQDDRPDVVLHWHEKSTWLRAPAPALVTGDVTDRRVSYEPLVGFTRLGNLLGQIERGGRSGV